MTHAPQHARAAPPPPSRLVALVLVAILAGVVFGGGWYLLGKTGGDDDLVESAPPPTELPAVTPLAVEPSPTPVPTPTVVPTPTPTPFEGWVDPTSSGQPWSAEVEGLLTFRGNPTRSWHGGGPVPQAPVIKWSYPPGGSLCGTTTIGSETEQWCGTGWTGQPSVFERDGATWAVFGAYDWGVHFLDADTGEALLPSFSTGDIIKGSVTIDPDGFPLVYSGSRDDHLHVLATDRDEPTELWRLSADQPGAMWNNDWDGSPMVIDDHLFQGGENSLFHVVKLNRGYDDDGLVTIDPELVFVAPGYDRELLDTVGSNVSIENSVAISGDVAYFANSGGLVQGWDIADVADGEAPERVFRYWVGDDVDASIVVDDEGFLYVGVEYEQGRERSREVGQIVKLDPSKPDDPFVWGVLDTRELPDGVWATPGLHRDLVIVPTDSGRVIGIERETGEVRWEFTLPGPLWSSPVIVDDVLIQGDCAGSLHGFDVSDTSVAPPQLWSVSIGGCIESTPAVWDGRIIVGTRAGQVHMLGD